MAGTFSTTGVTFSNLSRLELEQLRKADFYAGSKALTVGDDGTIVGSGSINAEPYTTQPTLALDNVYGLTPPGQPGVGLGGVTQFNDVAPSETVSWYGPTTIVPAPPIAAAPYSGSATGVATWTDSNAPGSINFLSTVSVNDRLCIKANNSGGGSNAYAVGTVSARTSSTLTLTNIFNPSGSPTDLSVDGLFYTYFVIRHNAIQLFAVPGSGPLGREQTFLAVTAGSSLHTNPGPSLNQINADRVTGLIPPKFGLGTSVDRADAVFGPPSAGPNLGVDSLGYRVVLYKSNNTGTGPDLTQPIGSLNPVIDVGIPAADQRMTIDYEAGIVRLSCAPASGGDIKPTGGNGGVNPTTGRLQLYAVFWAIDQSKTLGSARSLYSLRSTNDFIKNAAKVHYDTADFWRLGSSEANESDFVAQALGSLEDPQLRVRFGALAPEDIAVFGSPQFHGLIYRNASASILTSLNAKFQNNVLTFVRSRGVDSSDLETSRELVLADKTRLTVGDGTNPSMNPGGDFNPTDDNTTVGLKNVRPALQAAMNSAALDGYGITHVRRGRYELYSRVYVPPGVTVQGEGEATILHATFNTSLSTSGFVDPVLHFGANTDWGVYDFSTTALTDVAPTAITLGATVKIEGMDMVWNPVRRVWGLVQAETTTNSIWFNEMRPDGTMVLAGLGLNIKDSGANLYTSASANSKHHTSGHYPRIDHHQYRDEYAVVWVEEANPGAGVGPHCMFQIVQHTKNTNTYPLRYVSSFHWAHVVEGGGAPYSNHPSVAVDNSNPASTYHCAVSCWAFDSATAVAPTTSITLQAKITAGLTGAGVSFTNNTQPTLSIVSSTDVAWMGGKQGATFVYCTRKHPLYTGTTGVAVTASGKLTDAVFSAGNWGTTFGIEPGSRVVVRGGGTTDNGRTGIVRNVDGTSGVLVQFDGLTDLTSGALNTPQTFLNANGGTLLWAIAPLCRIYAQSWTTDGGSPETAVQIAGAPTTPVAATYYLNEREPDFPRITRGNEGRFLVTYQNFDTNGAMNRVSMKNFDNGLNTAFFSFDRTITLGSTKTHREHISTSYVVLETTDPSITNYTNLPLAIVSPSSASATFAMSDPNANTAMSRDSEVISRSLGGRFIFSPFANFYQNSNRPLWDVSYRSYSVPYGASGQHPSMIPDATWSGTDWTIVSPPVSNVIQSDTGCYNTTAGPLVWFTDGSFYFGDGGVTADGSLTRQTVAVNDVIYFPSLSTYATITAIHSEHTVQIMGTGGSGVVPGLTTGNTNISWVLVHRQNFAQGGVSGLLRNAGFRLTPEGKVTVTSNAITYAADISDSSTTAPLWPLELLNRQFWGDVNFGTADRAAHNRGLLNNQYNDLLPTSRLAADPVFKGVAVGAPKPFNQVITNEAPSVAIAWGENFYAFADRLVAGGNPITGTPAANQINLFRQSFGPYRSGARDMRLEGGNSSMQLFQTSFTHVFTKHGGPQSGSCAFATDGYRNVFAHWASAGFGQICNAGTSAQIGFNDPRDPRFYTTFASAIFTDALGRDPIRQRIGFTNKMPRTLYKNAMNPTLGFGLNHSVSQSVWTGKEYITALSTNNSIEVFGLPGDDGEKKGYFLSDELTGDSYLDTANSIKVHLANAIAHATVDCGAGGQVMGYGATRVSRSNPEVAEAIDFTMAWSGKVLVIAWVVGHNILGNMTFGQDQLGGALLGLTIIHPGHYSYQGIENFSGGTGTRDSTPVSSNINATTFILDQEVGPDGTVSGSGGSGGPKGRIQSARVTWDGANFVLVYTRTDGTHNWQPRMVTFPEQGPGSQTMIRRAAAASFASATVMSADGFLIWDVSTNNVCPYPGDVIEIHRGGTSLAALAGLYTVMSADPVTGRVWLGADLLSTGGSIGEAITASIHSPSVNASSYTAVGGVLLPQDSSTGASPDHDRISGGPTLTGSYLSSFFAAGAATTWDIRRIWALHYNEADDTYAIFYSKSAGGLYGMEISRSTFRTKEVTFHSATMLKASIGSNGADYFISWITNTGLTANYLLASRDLTIKSSTEAIATSTALYGNGVTSKPGPGYSARSTNFTTQQPVIKNIHVEWNNRLGRWAVSCSVLVNDETYTDNTAFLSVMPMALGPGDVGAAGPGAGNYPGWQIETWTGRSLALHTGAGTQPTFRNTGIRFIGTKFFPTTAPATGNISTITSDLPGTGGSAITIGPDTENGTYRGGSLMSLKNDTAPNFFSTGLGDYTVLKNTTSTTASLRRSPKAANRGPSTDHYHLYFEGEIHPAFIVTNGWSLASYQPTSTYVFNAINAGSVTTDPILTDVNTTEVTSATDPIQANNGGLYTWTPMCREDVFLFTFGYHAPVVQVTDADDCYLENVSISGAAVDIAERMCNMARPSWKVGGLAVGSPVDTSATNAASVAVWGFRPHVAHTYLTPLGKVETLRLTNVRSKTYAKYGGGPEANTQGAARLTLGQRNRRG